jgi:trimethylamine--corrinoid protein Co-methyltransferase
MGGIDSGITYSLHALLLTNDLAGMLRCLWNGVSVDDEQLALDLTHSVGPKGNYLGQRHTAVHCQENYWNSRYFGARFPRSNSPAIPDRELFERIDEDLREILATHRPEPLAEPLRKEIREILGRFEGT